MLFITLPTALSTVARSRVVPSGALATRRAARATKKRVRRTAGAAREAILDAAEKRLAEGGPAGLRIQEIARDVGISHPTLLHHFGSRAALVEAVVDRALEG